MLSVDYCILGAGPSGLTFACALMQEKPGATFVVIDKEQTAGGLCRSTIVDDQPLDIGGGHFLDTKRKNVVDFLFQFLPETEWTLHSRISKIHLREALIDHPLEANLWQLPLQAQVDFLESLAQAGSVKQEPVPTAFAAWVTWKFGSLCAQEYMLPYNRKIWSRDLNMLGTYWLDKLPDVSFRQTLESCLVQCAKGRLPAHRKFYYPKNFGYGEVWSRMALSLGNRFRPNTPLRAIDLPTQVINHTIRYKRLVNTIPWSALSTVASLPDEIKESINALQHTSIDIDYYPESLPTDAHWTYEPNESIAYHRILHRHNFVPKGRGYWTETNCQRAKISPHFSHRNDFAYPVNTIEKPGRMAEIRAWAEAHNIIPLGRWGTWQHMNSDVAVDEALQAQRHATL
jgi:protoporphyrinogen oxidase